MHKKNLTIPGSFARQQQRVRRQIRADLANWGRKPHATSHEKDEEGDHEATERLSRAPSYRPWPRPDRYATEPDFARITRAGQPTQPDIKSGPRTSSPCCPLCGHAQPPRTSSEARGKRPPWIWLWRRVRGHSHSHLRTRHR